MAAVKTVVDDAPEEPAIEDLNSAVATAKATLSKLREAEKSGQPIDRVHEAALQRQANWSEDVAAMETIAGSLLSDAKERERSVARRQEFLADLDRLEAIDNRRRDELRRERDARLAVLNTATAIERRALAIRARIKELQAEADEADRVAQLLGAG